MISKLGILYLLEDAIKSHDGARISLLEQKEHHDWSIVFSLASGCIVKCKLDLVQQEVRISLNY